MSAVTIANGHKNLEILPDRGGDKNPRPHRQRKNAFLAYWDHDQIGYVWKSQDDGVNIWCARVTVNWAHSSMDVPEGHKPVILSISAATPGRLLEMLAERYRGWVEGHITSRKYGSMPEAQTDCGKIFQGEFDEDED